MLVYQRVSCPVKKLRLQGIFQPATCDDTRGAQSDSPASLRMPLNHGKGVQHPYLDQQKGKGHWWTVQCAMAAIPRHSRPAVEISRQSRHLIHFKVAQFFTGCSPQSVLKPQRNPRYNHFHHMDVGMKLGSFLGWHWQEKIFIAQV